MCIDDIFYVYFAILFHHYDHNELLFVFFECLDVFAF